MDMYQKYTSPFGYQTGTGGIDTYGVNHNGFSLRDEIEYQFARQKRENELQAQYNAQGITENYPQYTTNFWGNSGNNYGFGMTNITDNIANRKNTTTPIPVATAVSQRPVQNNVQPQPNTSAWDRVKNAANNFAGRTEAFSVGYATGATLGNFDEGMGTATAAVTLKPNNYAMGRNATRQLQNDLQQQHPIAYGVGEFTGAMTTPLHFVKDTTFANKALNAATDTLNASAGYAENWDDFWTNLAVNGAANNIGLQVEQLPMWRAAGSTLGKFFAKNGLKTLKQGINSFADKMKNMYYNDDEDKEKYHY